LQKRLTLFTSEPATQFGKGTLLCKPSAQKRAETVVFNANHLIYDLTDDGRALLRELDMASTHPAAPGGVFEHRLMTACVTASIEIAAKETDITYRSADELLPPNTPLGTSFPLTNPYTGKTEERALIPDAVFGLDYPDGRRRIFFVEADRGTEPVTAKDFKRKSWIKSYLQYLEFVGRRGYQQTYGLKDTKAVVLVVTTSRTQQREIVTMLMNQSNQKGCTFMLFQLASEFNPFVKPPLVLHRLFNEPWERAGQPDLHINE